jgi:hypothetical protein
MAKKSHEPTLPADVRAVRESMDLHDVTRPISSSRDPRPSSVPVDLSSAPNDVQTGASAAEVLQGIAPPPIKPVKDATAGQRRLPYLA